MRRLRVELSNSFAGNLNIGGDVRNGWDDLATLLIASIAPNETAE